MESSGTLRIWAKIKVSYKYKTESNGQSLDNMNLTIDGFLNRKSCTILELLNFFKRKMFLPCY